MSFSNKFQILLLVVAPFFVNAQIVRMETVLGNIDIELRADVAPVTVANFLNYVNDGDYDSSFIHRSVKNFVIQGGGFNFIDGTSDSVPIDAPIINESSLSLSNARGTISMARTSDVNSATSQWFFNTANNANLDGNGDGYAVFGSVINGMDVVDSIAALQIWNAGGAISEIPLINYSGSGTIENDLVLLTKVYVLGDTLNINSGFNGAWINLDTLGQGMLIEVLPTRDEVFMAWFIYDNVLPVDEEIVNIGSAGQRWLTGSGKINHENNTVTLDLTNTSGGLFDNNRPVTNSDANTVGTVVLGFQDCSNIQVDYDLIAQELTGSFDMVRIAADNVELCESLSQAAAQ